VAYANVGLAIRNLTMSQALKQLENAVYDVHDFDVTILNYHQQSCYGYHDLVDNLLPFFLLL
jgi:hypothetical protein